MRVLFARDWPAVEAVADALLEHETLSGADVAATVTKLTNGSSGRLRTR